VFVCIARDIEREALVSGIPHKRVHYLPHGVDLMRFRPPRDDERETIRRQLGWPFDKIVVLFVGRLSADKGVIELLRAWHNLERTDAMLVLVGPDMPSHPWNAGPAARAFVDEHGLSDSVRFEGAAEDTAPFYRAADLFVQPSHFEALGNTALEAMASGLPVVTSGVGGLADFCVDEQTALLHRPRSPESLAQAVTRMLTDAPLRARLAEAGRRHVIAHFELRTLLDEYVKLIDSAAVDAS